MCECKTTAIYQMATRLFETKTMSWEVAVGHAIDRYQRTQRLVTEAYMGAKDG